MSESKTPRTDAAFAAYEVDIDAATLRAEFNKLETELSAALQRAEAAEAELIDMEAKLLTYKAKYGELG